MNFYKRFIGDITAKTGGLSMSRMGAYDRLLDHYFSTEKPIEKDEVYSICRAMNKHERLDVDHVLARFWTLTPEGYTQSKADEVIAKARPLIDAAKINGKKGGRPKKQNPEETQQVLKQNPEETQEEPSSKAIQSQSQISPSLCSGDGTVSRSSGPSKPEDVADQVWADWLQLRKAKKAPVTATVLDGARKEAAKAEVSLDAFLRIWCTRGSQGLQADWIKPHERAGLSGFTDRREKQAQGFAPGISTMTTNKDEEASHGIVIDCR